MQGRTAIGVVVAAGAVFMAAAQPIIVVEPQNQTIIEGGPLTFSVEATGVEPLRYQWLRYTNFATHSVVPGATNASIYYPGVPWTYHGFAVVVSDATGTVTSRIARIIYALRFLQHPASQSVTQDTTALFVASGTGAMPFTYQWYFKNHQLLGETSDRLALPLVEPADSGEYSVRLVSSVGTVTSKIATLTVVTGTNTPPPPLPMFVNFETAPVHPVALSPDRSRLAVCNLPDARLELFDVQSGYPRRIGSVPVGIDPVSAHFRGRVAPFLSNSGRRSAVNGLPRHRFHIDRTAQKS